MRLDLLLILGVFILFAVLEMVFTKFWSKDRQTRDDAIIEIVSTLTLIGLTQPFLLFSAAYFSALLFPQWENALSGLPLWAGFGLFLIFDDMTQYWWHRASHTFPTLYKLHRCHHNGEYLSIRTVYRNNVFYYVLMPGLWFSGVLIYLGLGWVYAGYLVIKMSVIYGAHSDVRWDEPLYKIKWLAPLMWIIERTISTPATHSAHHGKFASDRATHYKGNYGNLLFFWDVLFGTAKITRKYPERMGVENLAEARAPELLFWPVMRG